MSWKTNKNFTVKGGSDQMVWSALYLQNYLLFIIMGSTKFWEDFDKDIKVNGDKLDKGGPEQLAWIHAVLICLQGNSKSE